MRRIVETDSVGSVVKPRFTKASGGGEDCVAARLDPSICAWPLDGCTLYLLDILRFANDVGMRDANPNANPGEAK